MKRKLSKKFIIQIIQGVIVFLGITSSLITIFSNLPSMWKIGVTILLGAVAMLSLGALIQSLLLTKLEVTNINTYRTRETVMKFLEKFLDESLSKKEHITIDAMGIKL
jgi:hypothetical protein